MLKARFVIKENPEGDLQKNFGASKIIWGFLKSHRWQSEVFSTVLPETCQKKQETALNNTGLMELPPRYLSPEGITAPWVAGGGPP